MQVTQETKAGKPRAQALRDLTTRTGVKDLSSLVAMLVQTDRLGTSVAQALRVHADSVRTRRRQRAEEAAAKTKREAKETIAQIRAEMAEASEEQKEMSKAEADETISRIRTETKQIIIRVKAEAGTRAEVLRVIDIFRGKVVDVSSKSYAVEITGTEDKIQAVIDILKPIGIQEIVKTGAIAMTRAKKNL